MRSLFLYKFIVAIKMSCEETQSYKNLKLDDSQCLLVQFLNERKKPIQVGFQVWLKDKNINKEEIVIIHWPIDIDIVCAKSMERKLKNRKVDQDKWQDLPVKIIFFGGVYTSFLFILHNRIITKLLKLRDYKF